MKKRSSKSLSRPKSPGSDSSFNMSPPAADKGASTTVSLRPIHSKKTHQKATFSPLSKHAPVQNYNGFHNLIMLLLFVNNLRLVVENYIKYGLLISLPNESFPSADFIRGFACQLWVLVPVFVILWGEQLTAWLMFHGRLKTPETDVVLTSAKIDHLSSASTTAPKNVRTTPLLLSVANWVLIAGMICFGTNFYIYTYINSPLSATIPCFWAVILTMKMTSFVLVNAELRYAHYHGLGIADDYEENVRYPHNLTHFNLIFFLMAPTLCYQPSYPRTERFRKGFFLRRLLELVTLLGMMYFIAEQYSLPTLRNSLKPFHNLNFFGIFERLLKLSIPSIYVWLLMFYAVFHSWLNVWAEITTFADREFYKPWWNARNMGEYWRTWNIPVYAFFKRHLYLPLIIAYPHRPWIANAAAFFISAIGHEFVTGVPTQLLKGWAFYGMILQIPFIYISDVVYKWERARVKKLIRAQREDAILKAKQDHDEDSLAENSSAIDVISDAEVDKQVYLGNYMFWISFCIVGQPLCVLLYFRAWYIREYPELVQLAIQAPGI